MTVQSLDPVYPVVEADLDPDRAEHPMRKVTKQVAFDDAWTPERRQKVADLFDGMASDWTANHDLPDRYLPLVDALERGEVPGGCCLELGSGTGLGTRFLQGRFDQVIALDLAAEMLGHAPAALGHRVQGDAGTLPVASGSCDVVVLVNALLFPSELDRVLAPNGVIVWVNTSAENTPIHLMPDEVDRALPGPWAGLTSRANRGLWSTHRRVS